MQNEIRDKSNAALLWLSVRLSLVILPHQFGGPADTVGKTACRRRSQVCSQLFSEGIRSRLGYATSTDGTHFQREKTPVFYPDNDSQKELKVWYK